MTIKNKLIFQIITTSFLLFNLFLISAPSQKIFAATTITTCEELQAIPDGSTGDYLLGNDINCSSITNFTPVDNFGGTLDGQNHTISNLTINNSSEYTGLFGIYSQDISISNLNITNAGITGDSSVGCFIGGYAFDYTGGGVTLSNVHCSGSITGTSDVGGLVGNMGYITISNSSFTGTVGSDYNSGGLVGSTSEGINITGSHFNGDITGGSNTGGLIGSATCGMGCTNSIDNSYSVGTVDGGLESYIGGLVGWGDSITIDNCYSKSSISGYSNVGGLVGLFSGDTITRSYSDSSSIYGASKNVGGLVGRFLGGTITKSYSASTSISTDESYVGGIAGWSSNGAVISNCYSTSHITGYYIGGLVGHADTPNISQSYSTGVLSIGIYFGTGYPGGLIGQVSSSGVINNSFTISKDSSDAYISLIGETVPDASPDTLPTITNSYDALTTDISNFSDYSFAVYNNWDFTNIWSNTETYPTFVLQLYEPTPTPTSTPTPTPKVSTTITITTCEELQAIPDGSTDDYLLGNDINCSSITNFTPIPNFAGTLDGQNHTISNLTINSPGNTTTGTGLFGSQGESISISNLNITNANVTGGIGTGCLVGSFISENTGNIVNLSNVHCSGSIIGTIFNAGGLVGSAEKLTISNSSFNGTVSSSLTSIGGLVGTSVESINITGSHFNGDITGGSNTGGLIGTLSCWVRSCPNSIENSYSVGTVNGGSNPNIGGIVGQAQAPFTMENCYSESSVSGSSNVGGLVGFFTNGTITKSYSKPLSVSGDSNVGGLVGFFPKGTIAKSYSNSSSITGTSSNVGGLVGFFSNGTITKSYSASTSISTDESYVGGIAGWSNSGATISDCYSTSNATGHYVGGLVGYAANPNISQSYSTGVISVVNNEGETAGGLIGQVSSSGVINNSFTTSKNLSDVYNSLIGVTDPDAAPTVTNSYDALTTDISNFSDYSFAVYNNWDFTNIWSNTETYPTFVLQLYEPTPTPTPTETVTPIPTATITPTPTVTVDSNSNSDSSSSNSFGPPVCTDSKPIKTPDLFQVNASKNNAKLFFTPTDTNQYYISFSTNPNAEENGESVTLAREGVQSHTIYFLKPKTTYYVKVRSQNGCMPGDWSNIMKFTTGNSIFYKNTKVVSILKNVQSKSVSLIKSIVKDTKEVVATPTPTTVVKETKVETKTESVSTTNNDTKSKKCFLWWCW